MNKNEKIMILENDYEKLDLDNRLLAEWMFNILKKVQEEREQKKKSKQLA